jgi:hypothetical protein
MIGFITNWYMTRGDSQSAWKRCLPIWHRDGGIDDWRGIVGRPFYSPSRGVRLARMFAKRYSNDAASFLEHTQINDPVTALCAIDLLVQMATVAPQIIPMLTTSELPLTAPLRSTITSDAELAERPVGNPTPEFDTIGSYFRWQFEAPD